ncbi:glutathione hydrolase 5 proenzyme-like [Chanos chanos]|uniref:Glutathione hydrolase 5 proenzyme-like n=1 Tax=Chanos chanos TaxID=29144 RepID=A0A6J2UV47_CHACN|nr:glutathione hydrolase 5 proenzyme-like [Chanos chanos]
MSPLKMLIILLVQGSALGVNLTCSRSDVTSGSDQPPHYIGAVAADSATCSEIGCNILAKGGSAVDAAIATLLCTPLVHPQSMGLGGGSVFTVLDKDDRVKVFNAKETVPRILDKDLLKYCDKKPSPIQEAARWIGVPGELRAYERLHDQYGKLQWKELFEPVISLAEEGGKLMLEDLRGYRVEKSEAWMVPFGEYEMFFPPPPAGGALVSFILNVMEGKEINLHHDPLFYNQSSSLNHPGTSHVSVIAQDGTAVSVTSSINEPFGSMIYSPKTGIILNNQLQDFCHNGKEQKLSPGERPPSSMTPAILKSKSKTPKKILVIGGSGGTKITPAVTLSLINHLWLGMNLEKAISAPVLWLGSNNSLNVEEGFNLTVIEELKTLNHSISDEEITFYNTVNAILKEG